MFCLKFTLCHVLLKAMGLGKLIVGKIKMLLNIFTEFLLMKDCHQDSKYLMSKTFLTWDYFVNFLKVISKCYFQYDSKNMYTWGQNTFLFNKMRL